MGVDCSPAPRAPWSARKRPGFVGRVPDDRERVTGVLTGGGRGWPSAGCGAA